MKDYKKKEYQNLYDEIARAQELNFQETNSETFVDPLAYNESFEDRQTMLEEIIDNRENLEILDFGCGRGSYYKLSLKHNLYGLDISLENRLISENKGYKIIGATIEDIGQKKFDLIILVDVLEHLPNPDEAIGLIYDHLKPNGVLLLQVPYREDLSAYLSDDYPFKYVHLWSFDEFLLEILLTRRNSFNLIKTKYTSFSSSLPKIIKNNRYSLISKLVSKLYIYLHKISPNIYKTVVSNFNYPQEIIMVLQKQS
jgi:2-polyprenyl-3-methyl-5-hydroxy-6-metoxy-1,4-benzoquinol methylase